MGNIATASLLPGLKKNVHCINLAREFKQVRLIPLDSVFDRIAIGCRTIRFLNHRPRRNKLTSDRERVRESQQNSDHRHSDW